MRKRKGCWRRIPNTLVFAKLTTQGEQLLLNGEPICLRGALSWGWNAETIAPFYTPEQVREEIRRVRDLGFNLIKLCLLPNQTYYEIADEEGMLLWQEWPLWLPEVTRLAQVGAARICRIYETCPPSSVGCAL